MKGLECQHAERKAHPASHQGSPSAARDFAKAKLAPNICAFANSNNPEGGVFVAGVDNQGQLVGIDRFGEQYINALLTFNEG